MPNDIAIIPISNSIPGYGSENMSYAHLAGMKYKKLVPPWYIVKDYKEDHDQEKYTKRYVDLVLNHLNPHNVFNDFKNMSLGYDVALVCYEKSESFCHRHIVAEWLRDAGYQVEEWSE